MNAGTGTWRSEGYPDCGFLFFCPGIACNAGFSLGHMSHGKRTHASHSRKMQAYKLTPLSIQNRRGYRLL